VQLDPPMEMVCTGDRDLDLKINMRKMAQVLEEQILKNPSQWVVLQRIWDKDYTGIAGTEVEQASAPPAANANGTETSLNGHTPQLESTDPLGLTKTEDRGQKSEAGSGSSL